VHRRQSAGLGQAVHLANEELIVVVELLVGGAVSHVRFRIAVNIQVGERRRVNPKVDGLVGKSLNDLARIAEEHRPVVASRLVNTIHLFSF